MDNYTLYKKIDNESLKLWANDILDNLFMCEAIENTIKDYQINIIDEFKEKKDTKYGECDYDKKIIFIALRPHKNLAQLIDTFGHEIAHITTDKHDKGHKSLTRILKQLIKMILDMYLNMLDEEEAV